MTNRIFTYVDAVGAASDRVMALTASWESSWVAAGFDPLVLTELSDLTGPDIALHAATTRTYPTVNPRQYEDACWERWSAFYNACPEEGALFCDFDVFNTGGFTPDDLPALAGTGLTLLHEGIMPSFVAANPSGLSTMRDLFTLPEYADYRQAVTIRGRPHLSDMHVLARAAIPEGFDMPTERPCRFFAGVSGNPPPVVHFANDTILITGYPDRESAIRSFARGYGLTSQWGLA